jgi:flavorubredoxin
MNSGRQITSDLYYLGASDRRLALFENIYPLTSGVAYNTYLVKDEHAILFDCVDKAVADQFFSSLEATLDGQPLAYVVIQHVEPDHSATVAELLRRHPETKVIASLQGARFLTQFFGTAFAGRIQTVAEKATLTTGRHTFTFYMAPMVHWPEVMVTYDAADKALFSADAFGTFGALSGNLFADAYDYKGSWLGEYRRYYANIVGKYGLQVTALLKKAAGLEIKLLCPLHGPIWRQDLGWLMEKYQRWAGYTPEDEAVLIAYGSIYGHTEQAAELLAAKLASANVKDIALYDVSTTHPSYVVAEAFRCSHIVLASATYNNGIFDTMQTLVHDLATHNLQNRKLAVLENGSWAPVAGKLIKEQLGALKNIIWIEPQITIKSALTPEQEVQVGQLAHNIAVTMGK